MFRHYTLKFAAFAIAILSFTNLSGQIEFKIDYEKTNKRYIVSIIPMATYTMPDNLIGTSQITVKAETGTLFPENIAGLYPGVKWAFNSRTNAPDEASGYDYISFNLLNTGLLHLPLVEGKELAILAFSNELGCGSPVELINNDTDIFMPPNSARANVGNSMAILGVGPNAYGGVQNQKSIADCQNVFSHTNSSEDLISDFDLYPIPAQHEIFLEFEWSYPAETVRAEIVDALGRTMAVKGLDIITGENVHPFQISKLAAGSYFLKLTGESWSITLDKFQKMRL